MKQVQRFQFTIGWAALVLALATVVAADKPAAKQSPTPKSLKDRAILQMTGKIICAHCDLGIGDECCAGLQDGDSVVLLAGTANQELYEQRLNGGLGSVLGVLSVKDGQLHCYAVVHKTKGKPVAGVRIVGEIVAQKGKLLVKNGKHSIRLSGKPAKSLKAGRWAELQGQLKVGRKGDARLKLTQAKLVSKPALAERLDTVLLPKKKPSPKK